MHGLLFTDFTAPLTMHFAPVSLYRTKNTTTSVHERTSLPPAQEKLVISRDII